MENHETLSPDKYRFNPTEVVGDDLKLLEYQIPFSYQDKLARVALGGVEVKSDE